MELYGLPTRKAARKIARWSEGGVAVAPHRRRDRTPARL